MGKVKRTLSILLAVAMVVTCVPQTGLSALAATETPGITEAAETETAEVKVETPESNSEVADDAEAEDAADGEDSTEVIEEGGEAETPADDEQAQEPVVDDEAAEDGESEDVAKDLMDAEPYAADTTYNVTFSEQSCATVTDNAATTTASEDYTFKVQLKVGYKDLQVAAYTGTSKDEGTDVPVTKGEADASGVYTCTISNTDLVAIADGVTDITVEVSATQIQTYTLAIPKAANVSGVNKVEYATVPEGDDADWENVGDSIDPIEENTDVYVRVTADEGYTYTVKSQYAGDENPAEAAKLADKDYYKFTMSKNLTLTITASEVKTEYEVVVNGANGDSDKAVLTWVPENLVTTAGSKSTVPADTDLTFTVNVKEAYVETDKIGTVTYKIGASGTEKEITPDEEGVYTIGKAEIIDTVTIEVTTATYDNYAITFEYDPDEVNTPVITAGGKTLDTTDNTKWDATERKAIVSEKDEISFTLSMKETSNYEINKVTYGEEETLLDPAEGGTYKLGKVTKDTTVTVSLKVNEEKANRLTLAAEGSARGYSVTFIQDDENALDKEIIEGNPYHSGDKIVTLTPSFYALIKPGKGFELKGVTGTADGVACDKQETAPEGIVVAEGEELYKITYNKAAALELKVATEAIPSTVKQTVLFANKSGKLTYAVEDNDGKITKKPNTVNTYVVEAGATAFDFTVNAAIGYAPKVSYEDENGDSVNVDPEIKDGTLTSDKKSKAYDYKLTVGELPDNTVITLKAEVDKQTVSVIYSDGEVDITAIRIGAKEYDYEDVDYPDRDDDLAQMDIKVPHGETITISAEAEDNCEITSYTTTQGTTTKTVKSKPAGFEVSLKGDVTSGNAWNLTIASKKNYAGQLVDTTTRTELEPVKNVYTVDYDHTYTVNALHGAYDAVKLGKVEVLNKKSKAPIDGVTVTIAEDKESASFTLNTSAAAAKDLVVNLYAEGQENTSPVVTLALSVLPVITKITVTGVKSGAAEQAVDTWKDYAVKVDPKTANSGVLHAVVNPAVEGFDVSLDTEENKLWIKTSQTLDQTATVKFYTVSLGKTDEEANRTYIGATDGGEFTVKSVAQLNDKVQPTMKLASSDDTTLTLTLGAPKTVVDAAVGTVLYEVKITSKGAAKDTKNAKATEANVKLPAALGTTGTKTFYVPKTEGELSQEETFTVNGAAIGAGDAWEYDVTVTLVQAKENISDTVVEGNATVTLIDAKSSEVNTGNKPFATKVPYYEDKLTLKKGTTTIYTGQQLSADKKGNVDENGVLIATAQFGKNTTYTDNIWAEDDHGEWQGPLDLYVEGNKVYAKADKSWYSSNDGNDSYTALGKHKITVHADAADGMHSATATVDVTVVEGIEELQVNVPTTSLYKEDKKAASLKATVDYNPGGGKDYAPKTKKVEWEIHDTYGNDVNKDPESYLYKKVTVKNGSVSVDKNFVVSASVTDNQFYVYVKATDYYGNETEGENIYPITITNQAQDIGELVLAAWDDDTNEGYKVLARDGQSVTAAQLEGAQIFVLKRGTPEKTFRWDDVLDPDCFTFTSGNKAVEIDEYDNVYVNKPAKNVKLTATANDGSKQKVTMTLTVDYDTVNEGELGLKIETWDPSHKVNDPDSNAAFNIDGTTSAQYYATVVKKVGDEWTEISDYTDFKVTAKDAKFITGGWYNQRMDFVNTKKDAKITLSYSVPNGSGKFVKTTKEYTVTNTGYDAAKAPKVTLTGSLTAAYTEYAQVISGTITPDKSVTGYSFKGKQVKVEPDWTAANAKNLDDYYTLQYQLSDCYVDESGKLTLKFATEESWGGESHEVTRIPAGTYKLKVTTGTWNYDTDTVGGEFVPDSQAATVTLKAAARKVSKGSFKPTTTYTLSMSDSSVTLTGKGKDVHKTSFWDLKNDNVKGEPNNFTTYFTLDEATGVLSLNGEKLSEELSKPENSGKKLSEIIKKEDLTGYVSCWASIGTDAWGKPFNYNDTVKITVKLTDKTDGKNDSVKKYAASNATVLGGMAGVTANIAVTVDKEPADIALAYAEDGTNSEFKYKNGGEEGSPVVLQSENKPTVGKHNVDLYVVPADSYWVNVIGQISVEDSEGNKDADKTAEEQVKAIKANGIKLTVSVDVKDPANTQGKIKVGNTNVVFTNEQYSNDGFGNYWVDVPYTKVMDCEIDEIQVDGNSALNGLINFSSKYYDDGSAYISASINKKDLADAIPTNTKLNWAQKNIAVKVTVTFKNGKADENASDYGDEKKEETINFKVTLPKEPESTTFTEIVNNVKAHQDDIMNVVLPEDWSALDDVYSDDDGYTELDYVVHGIRDQVYKNLKAYVPGDSDVMIEFDEDMTYASNAGYTVATTEDEGSLIVRIALVDMTTGTEEKDANGNVTGYNFDGATKVELESEENAGGYMFVIPKASLGATDPKVAAKINALMIGISDSDKITISNATTVGDIRNYLKEGAEDVLGTNLVLWVTETSRQDATDKGKGHIYVKVVVQNRNGGESWNNNDTAYDVEIPKLPTVSELADLIQDALDALTVSNKTTQGDIEAVIKKVIDENNPDVTYEWAKKDDSDADDFTITNAEIPDTENGKDGKGSIAGKIVLTNDNTASESNADKKHEYSFSIEISPLKASDEAITAVAKAAIGEGKAKEFAKSNVEATVRQAVLDAANKAVENDPYEVSFKVENEKELFDFEPVKWNEDGEISYTLEVKTKNDDGTTGEVVEDSGALAQAAVTLAKDPDLQTLTEAKAEVEKKLEDNKETVWNSITNTTTEADALRTVKETLEGYVSSSQITVTVTKVSFTAATVKAGGELKCTWSLSKEGETATDPVELTITTDMLSQAKTDVADAAKEAAAKITVTTADFNEEGKADDKQGEIKKAVEDALADKFKVEVKTDLNIAEEPTLNKDGKATIVFSVKESEEDDSPVEVTCDYTLPALTQTVEEALDVITKAIEALTVTNESTDATVLQDLKDAVATTLKNCYTIAWSTEDGKGFDKQEADTETGTPAKITGTIVITQDDNEVGTVDVDKEITTEP